MAEDTSRRRGEDIAAHLSGKKDPFFGVAKGPRIVQLPLSLIDRNPDQPRKSFNPEKLEELKLSIERHGLMQPITVKAKDDDRYLLVAGERRFRAFELLGRETVPAIITAGDPDELALIENLQRENLNAVEEAAALQRMRELHQWTQEQLGEALGKTKSAISMTLKVLELPQEIVEAEQAEPEPLPKSILLELARVNDTAKQIALYQEARAGQLETARAMRQARLKGTKRKGEADNEKAAKPSPVTQAISVGRTFAKRLEGVSDDELLEDREQLVTLAQIVRQAAQRLATLSQAHGIGDNNPAEQAAE